MVRLGDHHPPAGSAGRHREGAAGAVPYAANLGRLRHAITTAIGHPDSAIRAAPVQEPNHIL